MGDTVTGGPIDMTPYRRSVAVLDLGGELIVEIENPTMGQVEAMVRALCRRVLENDGRSTVGGRSEF